jgi:monoamine oxidase
VKPDTPENEADFKTVLPVVVANAGPLESATELKATSAYDASKFLAGDDNLINQSMGKFVQAYGKDVPVCLNTQVTGIDYTAKGVTVAVKDQPSFVARTALITVSVGVLQSKKISFSPELPPWKLDAINAMQMGNMQKVIIPFKKDIFQKVQANSWVSYKGTLPEGETAMAAKLDPAALSAKPPLFDGKFVMAMVIKPLEKNIAIGFFGGDSAKALEGQCKGKTFGSGPAISGCDNLSIAITRSSLAEIFGKSEVDDNIDASHIQVTHWSLDPTSYGAYSAVLPGHWNAHAELAKPVSAGGRARLFFAGEGTAQAKFNGSFPGAYESGLKAAREIDAAVPKAARK